MCVCVCVFVRVFLGHLESVWVTLWHIFAFRPRISSKTIQFPKKLFFCRVTAFFLYFPDGGWDIFTDSREATVMPRRRGVAASFYINFIYCNVSYCLENILMLYGVKVVFVIDEGNTQLFTESIPFFFKLIGEGML